MRHLKRAPTSEVINLVCPMGEARRVKEEGLTRRKSLSKLFMPDVTLLSTVIRSEAEAERS